MAPEYAMRTYKADVCSFGVLTLEIISGRSNATFNPNDNATSNPNNEDCIYLLDLNPTTVPVENLIEKHVAGQGCPKQKGAQTESPKILSIREKGPQERLLLRFSLREAKLLAELLQKLWILVQQTSEISWVWWNTLNPHPIASIILSPASVHSLSNAFRTSVLIPRHLQYLRIEMNLADNIMS